MTAGRVDVLERPGWRSWASSWWAVLTDAPHARLRVYVACRACHAAGEYGVSRRAAARTLFARHAPGDAECREMANHLLRDARAQIAMLDQHGTERR